MKLLFFLVSFFVVVFISADIIAPATLPLIGVSVFLYVTYCVSIFVMQSLTHQEDGRALKNLPQFEPKHSVRRVRMLAFLARMADTFAFWQKGGNYRHA